MLPELPDAQRLDVQDLQELAGPLGQVVVNEVRDAEPLDVRPLEPGQMKPPLDERLHRLGVAGRAGHQEPGVGEEPALEEVGRVAQPGPGAALIVAVEDEEHPVLEELERAPELLDGLGEGPVPGEELAGQVAEERAAPELAQRHEEGQGRPVGLARRPLVEQPEAEGRAPAARAALHRDAPWRLRDRAVA